MRKKEPVRACVLGFPVSHSLSPRLHGYWLQKHGIDGEYTALATAPEQLHDTLNMLIDRGFSGCNLTVPLKEQAMAHMDAHGESCLAAGAVNTVVFRGGKKIGYNSDGFGFMESLRAQHPAWNGERVVILGTGGAARGIIAALSDAGAERFALVNRTPGKALKISKDLRLENAEIIGWENRSQALENATLLVHCTTLGMDGQPPLDIDLAALPETAAVCDIVYRPLMTPLLAEARRRGHSVIEGLPMLLHQGRLGFRYWFGVDPAVTPELYNSIRENAT